jgi:hypothetical protein
MTTGRKPVDDLFDRPTTPYRVIGHDVVDVRQKSVNGYRRVSRHKSSITARKKCSKLNREFVAKHHDNLYEE